MKGPKTGYSMEQTIGLRVRFRLDNGKLDGPDEMAVK